MKCIGSRGAVMIEILRRIKHLYLLSVKGKMSELDIFQIYLDLSVLCWCGVHLRCHGCHFGAKTGTCCGCVKSEIDAEKEPMCFLDLLCHAGPSTLCCS